MFSMPPRPGAERGRAWAPSPALDQRSMTEAMVSSFLSLSGVLWALENHPTARGSGPRLGPGDRRLVTLEGRGSGRGSGPGPIALP